MLSSKFPIESPDTIQRLELLQLHSHLDYASKCIVNEKKSKTTYEC